MYHILPPPSNINEKYRKLLIKNMEEIYNCLQVDEKLFAECFKIEVNDLHINGCKIEWDNNQIPIPEETFNIIIHPGNDMQFHTEPKIPFCVNYNNFSIRSSLNQWINAVANRHLFIHNFATNFNPIDPRTPHTIDIFIYHLRNRLGFMKNLKATIETPFGFKLFEGTMTNGHLTGQVNKHIINHPGWKTRLNIQIMTKKGKELSIRCMLKNGKLHGIVQIYGVLSRNVEGRCSDLIVSGLSFIGYFENGYPIGPCWRQLVGGSWLYGILDENHEFTGTDIAYLHQDLQLVMIGQFRNGMMASIFYPYKNINQDKT